MNPPMNFGLDLLGLRGSTELIGTRSCAGRRRHHDKGARGKVMEPKGLKVLCREPCLRYQHLIPNRSAT